MSSRVVYGSPVLFVALLLNGRANVPVGDVDLVNIVVAIVMVIIATVISSGFVAAIV